MDIVPIIKQSRNGLATPIFLFRSIKNICPDMKYKVVSINVSRETLRINPKANHKSCTNKLVRISIKASDNILATCTIIFKPRIFLKHMQSKINRK